MTVVRWDVPFVISARGRGPGWVSRDVSFYVAAAHADGALAHYRFLFRVLNNRRETVYSIPDDERISGLRTPESSGIIRIDNMYFSGTGGLVHVEAIAVNRPGCLPVRGQTRYSARSSGPMLFNISPDHLVSVADAHTVTRQSPSSTITGGFQVGTGSGLPLSASVNSSGAATQHGPSVADTTTTTLMRATELRVEQIAYR